MMRGRRKTIIGVITSDRMDKTVVISVTRKIKHLRYNKIINRSSKFKVHDENNECKVGDKVQVMETRPLSKGKRWRLVRVIEKAK